MTDTDLSNFPLRLLFERAQDGIDTFAGDGSEERRALDEIERRTASLERELTELRDRLVFERKTNRQQAQALEHELTELREALKEAAEELNIIDKNMAWEDVHRVSSRLAALSHHDEVPEVRPIESGPVMKRERHG